MSEFLGYFVVVFMALIAVVFMAIVSQKNYGRGYAEGYKNGGNEKYDEVYNKRLLRQSRRASREEKKNEPTNPEAGDGELQGNPVTSDRELFGGSGLIRSDDADPGAGEVPATEG